MSWKVVIHYIGVENKLGIVGEKSGPFLISAVWKGRQKTEVAGWVHGISI